MRILSHRATEAPSYVAIYHPSTHTHRTCAHISRSHRAPEMCEQLYHMWWARVRVCASVRGSYHSSSLIAPGATSPIPAPVAAAAVICMHLKSPVSISKPVAPHRPLESCSESVSSQRRSFMATKTPHANAAATYARCTPDARFAFFNNINCLYTA